MNNTNNTQQGLTDLREFGWHGEAVPNSVPKCSLRLLTSMLYWFSEAQTSRVSPAYIKSICFGKGMSTVKGHLK